MVNSNFNFSTLIRSTNINIEWIEEESQTAQMFVFQ